jgi:ADP-heptose:LPS heptosyltransferase
MRKLILKNSLSPGDIVMLTAAVRDLHRGYPGQFLTDVRTTCAALWDHNPYLTSLDEADPKVKVIDCHYPLIHRCNRVPYHCLHGFIEFLNESLGLRIKPTAFQGDIHLSAEEKSWYSQVNEWTGEDTPFWIVAAGGKYDATIKWWATDRYQAVVDYFRGQILFVQVGQYGHHHPRLEGVVDLRGKTDLRQLVRLVYHAQGVLCPVTALMHLAAAVETKDERLPSRPCVVIAGGREPAHWEAYPHHQYIHTLGALPCCSQGGCWRARTVPLGDGNSRDRKSALCADVVGELPRCMDMISAAEVIRRIELYYQGGRLKHLTPKQRSAAAHAVALTRNNPFDDQVLNMRSARMLADQFIQVMPPYPGGYRGRGIVICGGGRKYFPSAWVNVNLLRQLGCSLPIQLWHLGAGEMDASMKSWVHPLKVTCVDALAVRSRHPVRILGGWELKPYALIHCPFREVLLLDADNVPVVNPEFLFRTPEYVATGAIFWPDYHPLEATHRIWKLCGVPYRHEPAFESGQILVDKKKCWAPLRLCLWYNENSDFFYQHVHGDKDTFHLAFRRLNKTYSMTRHPLHPLPGVMCQHDFAGARIFQHRNHAKWSLDQESKHIPDFWLEDDCFAWLEKLKTLWQERDASIQ